MCLHGWLGALVIALVIALVVKRSLNWVGSHRQITVECCKVVEAGWLDEEEVGQ